MLKWLLSKHIQKEIKDHLDNLHLHLAHSFSNIKKDISIIHIHLKDKDKKISELEGKIQLLESKLFYILQIREGPKQIETPKESYITEMEIDKEKIIELNLASLTYTQKWLLKSLYELKTKYNKDIVTSKSLAKYVYPGRGYDSVRTTLSEYLNILFEHNLIKKERIGRRILINLTKEGLELSREVIKKDNQKKKQKINIEDDI